MSNKYFDGVVRNAGVTEDMDADLKAVVLDEVKKINDKMDQLRVADAITGFSTFSADATNISMRPCHGRWQRTRRRRTVLRPFFTTWLEAITIGASLLEAFMPETSDKILSQLDREESCPQWISSVCIQMAAR